MFYKVFGSIIIISYFYTRKKKIKNYQTTEYINLWDDLDNLDDIYELNDLKDF